MTADKDDKDRNPMVQLAEDAVELAAAGQNAMLEVFAAEMRALSAMASGQEPPAPDAGAQEDRRRADEAEIESGFDNMPV